MKMCSNDLDVVMTRALILGKCQWTCRSMCRICRWSDQVEDAQEQKKTKEFSLRAGRLGAKQKSSITYWGKPVTRECVASRSMSKSLTLLLEPLYIPLHTLLMTWSRQDSRTIFTSDSVYIVTVATPNYYWVLIYSFQLNQLSNVCTRMILFSF